MKAGLKELYGSREQEARERYAVLKERFAQYFGSERAPRFFSAPGRTEIIGNHVDHNGGQILAASITMDTIAAAAPSGDDTVCIISEGYAEPIRFSLQEIGSVPKCAGSLSLIAGMMEAAQQKGYAVGGFNACVSTQVIPAAGVSSSASFEMLVAQIVNDLFNGGAIDFADYARIGQYAENRFWDKASGLMDQMACAVGGTIFLDFSNHEVKYEQLDYAYDDRDCDLVIVNTGKGHADLSAAYSSIPDEMRAVAAELGVENLWESDLDTLLAKLPAIRAKLGNDRAPLRALHFYTECGRVREAREALLAGNKARMLELIRESGLSSARWLQNQFCEAEEQPICLALALSEIFFEKHKAAPSGVCSTAPGGVCRIHGGGFGGVIMSAVPHAMTEAYIEYMEKYFGSGNVYLTNIRAIGACEAEV